MTEQQCEPMATDDLDEIVTQEAKQDPAWREKVKSGRGNLSAPYGPRTAQSGSTCFSSQ